MHMKGFNGHPRSVLQTTGLTRALLQQATTRRYTSDRGSKPTEHPTPPMGMLGVFALYLVLEVGNNHVRGKGPGILWAFVDAFVLCGHCCQPIGETGPSPPLQSRRPAILTRHPVYF